MVDVVFKLTEPDLTQTRNKMATHKEPELTRKQSKFTIYSTPFTVVLISKAQIQPSFFEINNRLAILFFYSKF